MLTRRDLARRLGLVATGIAIGGEAAYAQRRAVHGRDISQLVLLNANENPDGPPQIAIDAMSRVLARSGRYHDEDTEQLTAAIASQEEVQPDQVLVGCGSSEILHCAVDAFTSPSRPLITTLPSYELPVDMASALGNPVIKTPMTSDYAADVRRMVAEAEKAKGGMIYVVNPNNPTSSITRKEDIAWLVSNLPADTIALIDEAYIHFSTSADLASALPYVRQGKNVVVARTFSKIYGMAGLRVGAAYAKPEFIAKMTPYRNNVIAYVSAQAVIGALSDPTVVPQRRQKMAATRNALCTWLKENKITYIEPHANFMMIDVGRPAPQVIAKMLTKGVAIGRPFPTYPNMIRTTIGSDQDMAVFRKAFLQVLQGGEA